MVTLQTVELSDKNRLWNIFQKYCYEMSAYYDMDLDSTGNYEYEYFDAYFEENSRIAHFIFDDKTLIGFVMINKHSCLNEVIDYAIAEFTIFPKYRKKHYGIESICHIFEIYHGRWEIKFSNQNTPAKALWLKATEKFIPRISSFNGIETVLSFIVN